MITEADAKKFQTPYNIETSKEISLEEAFVCVRKLVEMIRLVYRPIKKADYEKFIKNYNERLSKAKV